MRLSIRLLRSLSGRVSLVTGSTSGIGFAVAKALAAKGSDVILHGFGDDDVIAEAKQFISSHDVGCDWLDGDLCDVTSTRNMAEQADSLFHHSPDILVNCAGFQSVNPVTEFDINTWQRLLTVHLTAPFLLTQHLLPAMIKQNWGRIINISSVHGLVASPFKSAYVSAKHGLVGLTKVVALETARTGVTCNAVCPGWVETPLFVKQVEARSTEKGLDYEEAKRQIVDTHPSETPVKVEDVGELVCFLCSPAANQMTGSSLVIDGGWTAR